MLHILTVHWEDDRWIDVQLSYLQRHITELYRVYAFLNYIPEHHFSKFFYVSNERIDNHAVKLNLLADMAVFASKSDDDVLMFIDGDAFPIGDMSRFIRQNLAQYPLAAVQRLENNGDIQPHPCFCVTTVGLWKSIRGDWNRGYKWPNAYGELVSDVGGNLYGQLLERNIPGCPSSGPTRSIFIRCGSESTGMWCTITAPDLETRNADWRSVICRASGSGGSSRRSGACPGEGSSDVFMRNGTSCITSFADGSWPRTSSCPRMCSIAWCETRSSSGCSRNRKASRLYVKAANGAAGKDLLFDRARQTVWYIEHSKRKFYEVSEKTLLNWGRQGRALLSAAEKLALQFNLEIPQEWSNTAAVPALRYYDQGQGIVNGIRCRRFDVVDGDRKSGELCMAEANGLNIARDDYETLVAFKQFVYRINQQSADVIAFLGVNLPQLGDADMTGIPVEIKSNAMPEIHRIHLTKAAPAEIKSEAIAIPPGYVAAKLPLPDAP